MKPSNTPRRRRGEDLAALSPERKQDCNLMPAFGTVTERAL